MTITAATCTAISTIDGCHRVTTWTKLFAKAFLAVVVIVVAAIVTRHIHLRVAPEGDTSMEAVRDIETPPPICAPGIQGMSSVSAAPDLGTLLLPRACLES
ncbi:hypothetical protein [Cupriavidus taiwanensis]|uniref:hypothetical protein n=1 Tax=Cupriavidus taiwanensis TaxID=164546 RepID=UPI0011C030D0|nr:hypothetical protein [Cupriavidus taiwanensis]